jgi:predicted transcriptional regulator of viral defense system
VFRTTVLKTTGRVRRNSVQVLDHEYLVVHTAKSLMAWGLESFWHDGRRLYMADPARTIVDILDAPRLGGGIRHASEILAAYLDEHDPGRLVDYGDRLGNRTVFKRLGYLLESMARGESELLDACRKRVPSGVSLLDPDGPRIGPRSPAWALRVNVRVGQSDPS